MIIVPAMWPFPALEFEENIASLRLIALALMRLAARNYCDPICLQIERMIADIETDARQKAVDAFYDAMSIALDDCSYAPTWAVNHYEITYDQAASMRPAWTAHIARSIYEQIGA